MSKKAIGLTALIATSVLGIGVNYHVQEVEKWEMKSDSLLKDKRNLTEQNANLTEQRNALQGTVSQMEADMATIQEHTKQVQSELDSTRVTLANTQTELENTQGTLRSVRAELAKERESVAVIAQPDESPSLGIVMTGFEVTWYNDSGLTSTGATTSDGVTAAVDPSIIPYGSKLKITFPNGQVLYRTAQDTGGAVKSHNGGKVVDIYVAASDARVYQLGRTRNVKVEILG